MQDEVIYFGNFGNLAPHLLVIFVIFAKEPVEVTNLDFG